MIHPPCCFSLVVPSDESVLVSVCACSGRAAPSSGCFSGSRDTPTTRDNPRCAPSSSMRFPLLYLHAHAFLEISPVPPLSLSLLSILTLDPFSLVGFELFTLFLTTSRH